LFSLWLADTAGAVNRWSLGPLQSIERLDPRPSIMPKVPGAVKALRPRLLGGT